MNQIISRISDALKNGELEPFVQTPFTQITSLRFRDVCGDLDALMPTIEKPESFKPPCIQLRPKFSPVTKRSMRPLPLPQINRSNGPLFQKHVFMDTLKAVKAILELYDEQQIEKPDLDLLLSDSKGIELFFSPFFKWLGEQCENSLMPECLEENIIHNGEESVFEMQGLEVWLPIWHYDEEGVHSRLAFLEGVESVAGVLEEFFTESNERSWLSNADNKLIRDINWLTVIKTYADSKEEKLCDLIAIENSNETLFEAIEDKYPDIFDKVKPIIAGIYNSCLIIDSLESIHFLVEYLNAWDELEMMNPGGYHFDEEADEEHVEYGAAWFIRDVLKIYRIENGLPFVNYD